MSNTDKIIKKNTVAKGRYDGKIATKKRVTPNPKQNNNPSIDLAQTEEKTELNANGAGGSNGAVHQTSSSISKRDNTFRLNPKEEQDKSPVTLRFVMFDQNTSEFVDILPPNALFHINQYSETEAEIFQISKNFESFKLYTFGKNPRIESFSGILRNSMNYPWKDWFDVYYNGFLRGTKCAEIGAQVLLSYEDTILRGALLNVQKSGSSASPYALPFSFQMIVFKEYNPKKAAFASLLEQSLKKMQSGSNNTEFQLRIKASIDSLIELKKNHKVYIKAKAAFLGSIT